MNQIGVRIKTLRKNREETQNELAARAGVDATMVNKIEKGRSTGSMATLRKIAAALGVTLAELLDDANDPPNPAA